MHQDLHVCLGDLQPRRQLGVRHCTPLACEAESQVLEGCGLAQGLLFSFQLLEHAVQ
jgi:hypothetical protein